MGRPEKAQEREDFLDVLRRMNFIRKHSKMDPFKLLLYRLGQLWLRAFFGVFYFLTVKGKENIGKIAELTSRPILVVVNHASYFDPPLVASILRFNRKEFRFLTKEDVFFTKGFGKFIAALGAFPTKEEGDAVSLRKALRLLESKHPVVIFPEGTRSFDGSIMEFKHGAALLAYLTGAAILPVGLRGSYRAWPRQKRFPRVFVRISASVGEPIVVPRKKPTREEISRLTKALREVVKRLAENGPRGDVR